MVIVSVPFEAVLANLTESSIATAIQVVIGNLATTVTYHSSHALTRSLCVYMSVYLCVIAITASSSNYKSQPE